MASGKTHKIEVGGETINVPAWATEEQFDTLLKIDTNVLKSLDAMLRANRKREKVQKDDNKALLDSLARVAKAAKGNNTKTQQQQQGFFNRLDKQLSDANKAYKKGFGKRAESEKALNDFIVKSSKDLTKGTAKFTKDMASFDLKTMATALGSVAGLGTIAGMAAGVLEGFSTSIIELANTGVGLGGSLMDLRTSASMAGLDLASYSKVVNANSSAIKSLGANTTEGSARFATLARDMKQASRSFNNFGMTNTEMAETLAEEIELRRLSGMSQQNIQNGLADSMSKLMLETTQMAAATGQDRRELLRRRNDAMKNATVQAKLMAMQREGMDTTLIREKIDAITGTLGKGNEDLALAMAQAAMTDNFDFMAVDGGKYARLASMMGEESGSLLRNIFETYSTGLKDGNLSSEELKTEITAMVGQLGQSGSADMFKELGVLSAAGGEMGGVADSVIKLMSELGGMGETAEEVKKTNDQTKKGLQEQALLALPSSLEELANNIKESTLTTVLDGLGIDLTSSGKSVVEAIQGLADSFGPGVGLFEGAAEAFGKLDTSAQALLIAAGALSAASLLGGAAMGAKTLGRMGSGIKNVFKGSKPPTGLTPKGNFANAPIRQAPIKDPGKITSVHPKAPTPPAPVKPATPPAPVKPATPVLSEVNQASKAAEKAATDAAAKATKEATETASKSLLKKLPGVGILAGLAFGADRLLNDGDVTGAILEVASGVVSLVPGVGTGASVAIDAGLAARDMGLLPTNEESSRNEEITDFDGWTEEPNEAFKPEPKEYYGRGDGNLEVEARNAIVKAEERKKKLAELESALDGLVKMRNETKLDEGAAATVDSQIQKLALQISDLKEPDTINKSQPESKNEDPIFLDNHEKGSYQAHMANSRYDNYKKNLALYNDTKKRLDDFVIMVQENPNLLSDEDEAAQLEVLTSTLSKAERQLQNSYMESPSGMSRSDKQEHLLGENGYTPERLQEIAEKMGIGGSIEDLGAEFVGQQGMYQIPKTIQGKAIPKELYNQFELDQLERWRDDEASMGRADLSRGTSEIKDVLNDTNARDLPVEHLRDIIMELRENNRILRKQLRTTEDVFF